MCIYQDASVHLEHSCYLQHVLPVWALKILPLTICSDSPNLTPSWTTASPQGVRVCPPEIQPPVVLLAPLNQQGIISVLSSREIGMHGGVSRLR